MEYSWKEIDITTNYVTTQDNLPEIDHAIRTIKELFRALYHRLPYNATPKVMVRHGVNNAVKWTNMFPPKGGVSKTYIPI